LKIGWLAVAVVLFLIASVLLINGLWWLLYIWAPGLALEDLPGFVLGYATGLLLFPGILFVAGYKAWRRAKQPT